MNYQKNNIDSDSDLNIDFNGSKSKILIGNEDNKMVIKSNYNKIHLIQKNYADYYIFKYNGKIKYYYSYDNLRITINNLNDGDALLLDNGTFNLDLLEVETTNYNNANCAFKFDNKNNLIIGRDKTIIKTSILTTNRDTHLTIGLYLENALNITTSNKFIEIRNIILEFHNDTLNENILLLEDRHVALHACSTNNFKFYNCVIKLFGNRFSWVFDNNNSFVLITESAKLGTNPLESISAILSFL